jgi:hypothetical protein
VYVCEILLYKIENTWHLLERNERSEEKRPLTTGRLSSVLMEKVTSELNLEYWRDIFRWEEQNRIF